MIVQGSLVLDLSLLVICLIRRKDVIKALRFLAWTVLVGALNRYMILGISLSFGEHWLVELVCTAAAKIFVIWIFFQRAEGEKGNVPVYLLTILLSLCVHENPLIGMGSGLLLMLYLLYMEKAKDMSVKEETKDISKRESSLYLKTIEDSYRKNRALMHDLKNHMIVLQSLAQKKEYDQLLAYTDSMAEKVEENLFPVHSGNTVLDALLADKYHTARRNGIFVEFRSIRYEADLDSQDLCTIIGNLFDNAITENLKADQEKDRWISVFIHTAEEEVIVELKNPLFHTLKIQNGLPISDKPDLEHHGIGLRNIRRVCDAYNGTLIWDDTEGIFKITVMLKMTSNL